MKDALLMGIISGGYAHKMPFLRGTFGTMGATVIYLAIWWILGQSADLNLLLGLLVVAYTIISFFAEPWAQRYFNHKDPGAFIIDEWAGYFVTMLFIPATLPFILYGFVVFRAFDIVKPFPIRRLENLRGGIVWDDLLAGVYANLTIQLVIKFLIK